MNNKYSIKDENFIKKNYRLHGAKYCASYLNRSIFCIQQKANRLGIFLTKKEKRNIHIKAREHSSDWYDINPDLFTDINLPEVAYFLGYLWADGHVSIKKERRGTIAYIISLEIGSDDYNNISKTLNKIGKWKIYKRNRQRSSKEATCIKTGNKPLVIFLVKNDYHTKSLVSPKKILSKIPENLKHYWWRGYFDGDGSFIYYPNHRQYGICFAGSYRQDWSKHIKLLLDLNIKIKVTKRIRNNGRSSDCRCFNIKCIYEWGNYIYKNYEIDNIGLARKWNKWKQAKDRINSKL